MTATSQKRHDDDILDWLETAGGQKWLNANFRCCRYPWWANIKLDSEGNDAAWHWNPGSRKIVMGDVQWVEPAVADVMASCP